MGHLGKALTSFIVISLITVSLLSSAFAEDALPEYQQKTELNGTLTSVGSDSMDDLMSVWVQEYKQFQPKLVIQIQSRGSASAPPALIEGVADLGPMSRPMKTIELESFKRKYGFEPTQLRTAIAGISIYVSKDNPIQSISLAELDALFSEKPKRGHAKRILNWGELGVTGNLAGKRVMTVGDLPDSYAYGYLRQRVLLQESFHRDVVGVANVNAVLETIALNKEAIGYGKAGHSHEAVKVIPVSLETGGQAVLPTDESMISGSYPLSRYLNVYIVREPNKPLDQATSDFLRFILSKQGQEVVKRAGLIPLPASVIEEEREKAL